MHTTTSAGDIPRQYCSFLADYASYMLGCGATCRRINRNISRIAATIGMGVHLIILPNNIIINLTRRDDADASWQQTRPIARSPISYYRNALLSRLSWQMADRSITFEQARRRMRDIVAHPAGNPWRVLVLAAAANAAFCRLFGGDAVAMLVVAAATALGYSLKNILSRLHTDPKLVWLSCSAVSAVSAAILAYGTGMAPYTSTADIALATSVLYLVPGIPFINSVSDMLDGHYLCAFSRFMNALILTACLALGLTAGFLAMNLRIF